MNHEVPRGFVTRPIDVLPYSSSRLYAHPVVVGRWIQSHYPSHREPLIDVILRLRDFAVQIVLTLATFSARRGSRTCCCYQNFGRVDLASIFAVGVLIGTFICALPSTDPTVSSPAWTRC